MSAHANAAAVAFDMTRAELQALCIWNDPNGCYRDADCMLEFGHYFATDSYRRIVYGWIVAGDMDAQFLRNWRRGYRSVAYA